MANSQRNQLVDLNNQQVSISEKSKPVMMNTKDEDTIDLVDLFMTLVDKWHIILLCLLAGAVLVNAFAFFGIKPTYTSTAKMYIVSASDNSVVNLSDLNIGQSLTSDYEVLMKSYPVLDQVIEELNLDMTTKELANLITINTPANTRILEVTCTYTDRELARDIANAMVEVSIDYLPKTMSTDEPNVAQVARLAEKKTGPSYGKFTIIGALLGAILACAFFIVRYLMDDVVRTSDDLERYFGVTPLAVVPDISAASHHSRRDRNRKRRKR